MDKSIIILGSTGSVGSTTLSVIKNNNFKVKLLSTNKNASKLLKQAILYKVKDVIIEDENKYKKYYEIFKRKKIRLHLGLINIKKILNKRIYYCVNSISGIDGLSPTLDVIPLTKNLLIANKESIICGWNLIESKLNKYKTKFIPIDSEHFSIWNLIKSHDKDNIQKIVLTASGGPFLKISNSKLLNVKPNIAIRHPNWKMGRKISIDSSTMMNKIFEYIEAKKIFNLKNNHLSILIHPKSYVHAIIFFKGGIIKFLAHETKMNIPISNAMNIFRSKTKDTLKKQLPNLNDLKFILPNKKKFPLLSILSLLPEKNTYFETILITLNDNLVDKYLNGKINYISITRNLLRLIKSPYFLKYYKLKPKNIYDIKKMIKITKNYLDIKIKYYAN